jgi:hypothetical protein
MAKQIIRCHLAAIYIVTKVRPASACQLKSLLCLKETHLSNDSQLRFHKCVWYNLSNEAESVVYITV